MTDISLITTTELLDEVSRRVDAFVFIAYQDRSKQSYALMTEFKGNSLEIIGLSEILREKVRTLVSNSKELSDE